MSDLLERASVMKKLRQKNERLEAELEKACDIVEVHDDALRTLNAENARLREALEKVLNHWPNDPDDYADGVQKIAREALK